MPLCDIGWIKILLDEEPSNLLLVVSIIGNYHLVLVVCLPKQGVREEYPLDLVIWYSIGLGYGDDLRERVKVLIWVFTKLPMDPLLMYHVDVMKGYRCFSGS